MQSETIAAINPTVTSVPSTTVAVPSTVMGTTAEKVKPPAKVSGRAKLPNDPPTRNGAPVKAKKVVSASAKAPAKVKAASVKSTTVVSPTVAKKAAPLPGLGTYVIATGRGLDSQAVSACSPLSGLRAPILAALVKLKAVSLQTAVSAEETAAAAKSPDIDAQVVRHYLYHGDPTIRHGLADRGRRDGGLKMAYWILPRGIKALEIASAKK